MAKPRSPDPLAMLRDALAGTVRRSGPDMSSRQFAVFLICHHEDGLHTVRDLAARLGVLKPAITRSLDRLVELGLARRISDPRDRRSVLVQRTAKGVELLAGLRALLQETAEERVKIPQRPCRRREARA
jgi:DNA-binding MarR family transcriptional regulator